ncbi:MAG: Nif3-like dinuclear metal center hexameric protein [Bacteroidota bacterium]
MKISILSLFSILLFSHSIIAQNDLTVNDVINKIKSEVGIEWMKETRDNVIAGNPNLKVTGIATTFMSTLAVLQKAKAAGCNFVISHEPTFYTHTDDLRTHEKDPVQIAKLKFIQDNGMVVWRFHDHQHRMKSGDQIYEGVVEKMGWKKYATSDKTLLTIPPKSLAEIVKTLQKNMGAKTVRIVGKPNMMVTKVGLALGAAGTGTHFNVLETTGCELLIVGESNEWETVPYVQDAITLGQKRALIVLGHADSEENGMLTCANWLKKFYPKTKIEFIKAGNPYWRN